MLSTTKIDWFTGVSRYVAQHPLPLKSYMATFVPCAGWSGYDVGEREIDTNLKRYSSTTRPDMGFAIVASATALARCAEIHENNDMLAALWEWGFKEYRATRLDLAVDLYDGGELAHRVARAVRRKVVRTAARQTSVIEGITGKGGITSYIGSRGSTRFVRVYDKNAESGGKVAASRFELQANSEFASELWKSIRQPSQDQLNTVAYAAINGLVSDWGDERTNKEMQFILASKPPPKPEPSEDAWEWISKQVLPTLTRDFYLNGQSEHTLLQRLIDAVKRGDVE